ncbi:MAG: hypothetical protein EZS28_043021, partial [Streblomastix strix]
MLSTAVVSCSSQNPDHPSSSICSNAENSPGWVPARRQDYPQHITLSLLDGRSKVKAIRIRVADPELRQKINIQFGHLKAGCHVDDFKSYDYHTAWNGEKDQIEDDTEAGFTIKFETKVQFIRIQQVSAHISQVPNKYQKSQGIISVQVFSERIYEKIKLAKVNGMTQKLNYLKDKVEKHIDNISYPLIPPIKSLFSNLKAFISPVEKKGAGQAISSYLYLMFFMTFIFVIGMFFFIPIMIICSKFSKNAGGLSVLAVRISIGSIAV